MNAFFSISPLPPIYQIPGDASVWPYFAVAGLMIIAAAILYLGRLRKEHHRRHSTAPRSMTSDTVPVRQIPRTTKAETRIKGRWGI